ncbi:hypothetical protein [Konateibacter massiliensis]|uniref:hypothetical protein n=1 Tax=Konateibacter massiliensis TaxID=2002841 RepID=UPI000C15DB80|nr:hypothetical protein [Konateibacter massiliensis]
MCRFKSAVILKNRVILAPEGNESHSDLLRSLNIEDSHFNASKTFVRAELVPPDGNKAIDIDKWEYIVDQDIVPDWFDEDSGRYEIEMRNAVGEYMKDKLKNIICGYDWTPVTEGEYTYYFMNGIMSKSNFGKTNDYRESAVRADLLSSNLLANLKEKFGDNLVPITLDLTSMDGFKDYGNVEGDLLAIPNIELLMKFGNQIQLIDNWYWLATPNQTPSRRDSSNVQCVGSDGLVDCCDCCWNGRGVRPFFILKSDILVSASK